MKTMKINLDQALCEQFVKTVSQAIGITPALATACQEQFMKQVLSNLAGDEETLKKLLGADSSLGTSFKA